MSDWSFGTPAPAPVKRRGGGLIITGTVLLLLGVVAGIVAAVLVARSFGGVVEGFGQTYGGPAVIERSLEGGRSYTVYELLTNDLSPSAPGYPSTTVPVADISVLAPGGYEVPVLEPQSLDGTYEQNGQAFEPVGVFDAPTTGSYEVTVVTEGATVALAPGFGTLAVTGVAVVGLVVAVLVGVVGLVLLVVGVVMRSRKPVSAPAYGTSPYSVGYGQAAPSVVPMPDPYSSPSAQPVAPQPVAPPTPALPAGWYPDPQRPGGQRWWDGARWTDHLA